MDYETPALSEKQMSAFLVNVKRICDEMSTCPPDQFHQITIKRLVAKAIFETPELDDCDELLEEPTVINAMSYESAHITERYPAIIKVRQIKRS